MSEPRKRKTTKTPSTPPPSNIVVPMVALRAKTGTVVKFDVPANYVDDLKNQYPYKQGWVVKPAS